MKNLLESGVHFGHQVKRWDPRMKKYIFAERNGIHIIDLQKTIQAIKEAYDAVQKTVGTGKSVLFVGTKKQAQNGDPERGRALRAVLREQPLARRHADEFLDHQEVHSAPQEDREDGSRRDLREPDQERDREPPEGKDQAREEPRRHQGDEGPSRRDLRHRHAQRRPSPSPRPRSSASRSSPSSTPTAIPRASPSRSPGNDDAIRSISLFTQIIANAVVEAGAAEGLKIIENLSGEETEEVKTDAAPSAEDDEVEIDPATYAVADKPKAEETVTEEPAPIIDDDRLYEAK